MPSLDVFASVAPHLADTGKGVRAWLIEPGGLLTQLSAGTFFDVDVAMFISTTVDAAMRARFASVARFIYVHDFSAATGYSTHARQIFTSWAQSSAAFTDKVVVIPPDNAVFRMGMTTMQMALRVAGIEMITPDSLQDAIAQFNLRPAP